MPEKRKKPRVADLVDELDSSGDVADVATDGGMGEDALTLHIDRDLGTRIWNGTTFEDRTGHLTNQFAQDMVTQAERSLLAQETYAEFEARMLKQLGVADPTEPAGALWKFERQLGQEARLAWNTGMVAANAGEDTALVSRSVLKETTTPGCAARHGALIEELGETPPYHEGCLCDIITIPNPDSEDPETAAAGQAILDDMAEERASWGADPSDMVVESEHVIRIDGDAIARHLRESGNGSTITESAARVWEGRQQVIHPRKREAPKATASRFSAFRELVG